MNVLKIVGLFALGTLVIGGGIAGVLWWQARNGKLPTPTPSNPPRKPDADPCEGSGLRADGSGQCTPPAPAPAPNPNPNPNEAHCRTLRRDELAANLVADIEASFGEGWPPTAEQIDKLETGDVIVFGVESEPTQDFDLSQQELVSATVLSVGKSAVRARVIGPIEHAEHHGNSAGHGLYVGSQVDVPRSHVLLAGKRNVDPTLPKSGYGSRGRAARVFKSTYGSKTVHKVHPSTVYDLELPYQTPDLVWVPSRTDVHIQVIGDEGLRHQIQVREDSVRGPFTLTLLDDDEREGNIFVARWDMQIAE
ncbi:hypothetical protein ACNOYE_07410 [Nannocystaceae bacterium ST9]